MTRRRVENTRVHFGANSPVSVKANLVLSEFFNPSLRWSGLRKKMNLVTGTGKVFYKQNTFIDNSISTLYIE